VHTFTDYSNLVNYIKDQNLEVEHKALLIQVFTALIDPDAIGQVLQSLRSLFPHAVIIGATTDGEIANGEVLLHQTILHFTFFEFTQLETLLIEGISDSFEMGKTVANELLKEDTKLLLMFSDGLQTNGEILLEGVNAVNPEIKVAGGMAGDYSAFDTTFIFNKDTILSHGVVAVALHSTRLKIFNDYNYNWQKVGRELEITKCDENRVYEIDGKSAVDTYKEYLGDAVSDRLPAIGIEFPLINYRDGIDVARAVVARHDDGSLTFAGNMYEGEKVYFGYGDSDEIMNNSHTIPNRMLSFAPEAIFVYSCMARRHFIGNNINKELAPLQALAPMAGFFTYGEFFFHNENKLLNQTLTVVGLTEETNFIQKIDTEILSKKEKIAYNSVNALIQLLNKTSKDMMHQKVFAETNARFEQLFEYSGDGIVIIKENRLVECNLKILSLFKCKEDKEVFLEQSLDHIFATSGGSDMITNIIKHMDEADTKHYLSEIDCRALDGTFFWAEVMFTQITLDDEKLLYVVFRDVSQRKALELELMDQRDMLYYKAHHDELTGLPNRKFILEAIEKEVVVAKKEKQKFALLFFDLDGLKVVNDSLGHEIGDRLIILTAKRIEKSIRSNDLVARIGGDEFIILLRDIDEKMLTSQIEKILGSIREEIILDMHHLYSSASIGVAIYPKDTDDVKLLLKYADSALYEAKELGRNQCQYYSSELTQKALAQVRVAKEFRQAIQNKEFEVYYQPQVDITTNRLIGVEALIRWNHPTEGFLTPIHFLHKIEKANLLGRLDKWVMNQAMKEIGSFHAQGLFSGKLSLNVAMSQIENDKWERRLNKVISRLHFNPEKLELEITETEIMKYPDKVISRLESLREKKIDIAIDDFGTGYSSLAKLKHLPFDKLKIDKIFVDDLPFSYDAAVMFKTIMALANNMNIRVLAEGIETKEQVDYLLEEGCRYVQGYYYYKPLSAKQLREVLVEQKKLT